MKQKKGGNDFPSIAYCQKSGGGRIFKKESEYVYAKNKMLFVFCSERRGEIRHRTGKEQGRQRVRYNETRVACSCVSSVSVGWSVGWLFG